MYLPARAPSNTSFIQDAGSRRILGFTVTTSVGTSLVTRALEQAVATRRRCPLDLSTDELIHHDDKGSQYTSLALSQRLSDLGNAVSTGRTGTALDNAATETTIGLYKTELIRSRSWTSRQEVETATAAWVKWFNKNRLHSALGYQPHQPREPIPSTTAPAKPGRVRQDSLQEPVRFTSPSTSACRTS